MKPCTRTTAEPTLTTVSGTPEPVESARQAGLRYYPDTRPGLGRRRACKLFRFVDAGGQPVRDPETLDRIRALAIPPAWTEVWICPVPNGHLQATGRDSRGRKQYRYHARWRATRDDTKYYRMLAFARALPAIHARADRDLARQGLPREKVLATVVRLLETTHIRVGNEEYAKENGSFGLTTLRTRHVRVAGEKLYFAFRGKSGVRHRIDIRNGRLARVVRRCRELPGHELFQYLDEDGSRHAIESADVNDYLRAASGQEFTAKDFRTWAGTVLAAQALRAFGAFETATQAKLNVVAAVKEVAQRLGNTPAVCRKSYVHPAVLDAYLDGTLLARLKAPLEPALQTDAGDLPAHEAVVLAFLDDYSRAETASAKAG